MNAPAQRQLAPIAEFRGQLEQSAAELAKVLPSHISPDKLQRTIVTACQQSPKLLEADRRSLLNACFKAAQDGLLPDGREAALVPFNERRKVNGKWESKTTVAYMPMVYGLRKKILQSGEVADIHANVVYRQEVDEGRFIYEEGTERTLRHKPCLDVDFDPSDDDIVAAYSVARFKDGGMSFEVMRRAEINKVRQCSQTGALGKERDGEPVEPSGPWVDWFPEQAKKTVIRRHSKMLPQSGDIIDVEAQEYSAAPALQPRLSVPAAAQPAQIPASPFSELGDGGPGDDSAGETIEAEATPAAEEQAAEPAKPQEEKAEPEGNAPAPEDTEASSGAPSSTANGETTSDSGLGATTSASPSDEIDAGEHPADTLEPSPSDEAAERIAADFRKAENVIDLNSAYANSKDHRAALPDDIREKVEAEYVKRMKHLRKAK